VNGEGAPTADDPAYDSVLAASRQLPPEEWSLSHFLTIDSVEETERNQRGYSVTSITFRIHDAVDSWRPDLLIERVFARLQQIAYKNRTPLKVGFALAFDEQAEWCLPLRAPQQNSAFVCANEIARLQQSARTVSLFDTSLKLKVTSLFAVTASGCSQPIEGNGENFLDASHVNDNYCIFRAFVLSIEHNSKGPEAARSLIVS
jgi:hypothetical protein